MLNRAELQKLAEDRLLDAEALLAAGRWAAAYYMAGYAVECGLKACIARRTQAEDFPPKIKVVQECYTHDFDKLVKSGGLKGILSAATAANLALSANWGTAKDWSEESRYEQKSQAEAQLLYNAITDPTNGVMSWIRMCW